MGPWKVVVSRRVRLQVLVYDDPAVRTRLEDALASLDLEAGARRAKELAYLSNLVAKGERCDGERIKADQLPAIIGIAVAGA